MLKDYIIPFKEDDVNMIKREVAEKGLGNYLLQQLHYLDATRTMSNGMRPEQTISHIYMLDVSRYLYVVNKYIKENIEYWLDKLTERHEANLAYEKENPPIVYDTRNINKSKRIRKAKEGILPGFEKPKRMSKAKLKAAKLDALKVSLKLIKPNDTV
jgi:hypothetical protein